MDEQHIQLQAANLLLERGIRFPIIDAPFYLKILRLNKITIAALKPGTIAEYSLIIISKQLDLRINDREYLNQNIESICKVIAIAILNSRIKIALLTGIYTKMLMWKIPFTELVKMFVTLVEMNRAADFTTITTFLTTMMKMMLSPKVGQKRKGS